MAVAARDNTMAAAPIAGAWDGLNPNMITPRTDVPKPVMIPIHAENAPVFFQNSPNRKGAKKDPDIVPHEKDINVRIAFG